ncbi:unnamed protein product, partial [Polarella glacialis]
MAEAIVVSKQEPQKPQRRKRGEVDADALFLPPCVRKARRVDSTHWANPSTGWKPAVRPALAAAALPLAEGASQENLWAERQRLKKWSRQNATAARKLPAVEGWQAETDAETTLPWSTSASSFAGALVGQKDLAAEPRGETLDVQPDDEPSQFDMLTPEESIAKSEIWHEVNRDLLEYWDGKRRRKREMQRAEEKSKEKALEDLTRIAQFEKHRQERQEQLERTKQRRDALDTDRRLRALSQLDGTGDGEAEDDGQMEQDTEEEEGGMLQFWQADGSRKQTFTPHA